MANLRTLDDFWDEIQAVFYEQRRTYSNISSDDLNNTDSDKFLT